MLGLQDMVRAKVRNEFLSGQVLALIACFGSRLVFQKGHVCSCIFVPLVGVLLLLFTAQLC